MIQRRRGTSCWRWYSQPPGWNIPASRTHRLPNQNLALWSPLGPSELLGVRFPIGSLYSASAERHVYPRIIAGRATPIANFLGQTDSPISPQLVTGPHSIDHSQISAATQIERVSFAKRGFSCCAHHQTLPILLKMTTAYFECIHRAINYLREPVAGFWRLSKLKFHHIIMRTWELRCLSDIKTFGILPIGARAIPADLQEDGLCAD